MEVTAAEGYENAFAVRTPDVRANNLRTGRVYSSKVPGPWHPALTGIPGSVHRLNLPANRPHQAAECSRPVPCGE